MRTCIIEVHVHLDYCRGSFLACHRTADHGDDTELTNRVAKIRLEILSANALKSSTVSMPRALELLANASTMGVPMSYLHRNVRVQ